MAMSRWRGHNPWYSSLDVATNLMCILCAFCEKSSMHTEITEFTEKAQNHALIFSIKSSVYSVRTSLNRTLACASREGTEYTDNSQNNH